MASRYVPGDRCFESRFPRVGVNKKFPGDVEIKNPYDDRVYYSDESIQSITSAVRDRLYLGNPSHWQVDPEFTIIASDRVVRVRLGRCSTRYVRNS